MPLKSHLLSERRQFEEATYYAISTASHSGKDRTVQTVERWAVARGWGGGDEQAEPRGV